MRVGGKKNIEFMLQDLSSSKLEEPRSVFVEQFKMQNVETGIDAIDVHPCVGTHCNMDSEQDSICEREVNEYKVINARPRIITPYKRKARLPSNTRVSVVSAHHFEIEYETQRWGTTDQPEEDDKIIMPSIKKKKKKRRGRTDPRN